MYIVETFYILFPTKRFGILSFQNEMLMKLPALLELLCLLVMVNVSMVGADTSESRRNGTVPNLDIDAMKGLVNILNSSSFMSNETLDGDYTVVKGMLTFDFLSSHILYWS